MRIVVITGASSGIGLKTKQMFEDNGDLVINLSRSGEGENFIRCDVSSEADIISAFNIIKQKYKKVDVLINNAGYGMSGAMELVPTPEAERIFKVNVFGVLLCCKHCLPLMEKGSKIINIGSAMGLFPLPFRGLYAASKASVIMLSQALRMECSNFGVSVSVVCPGDIKTNFTKNRVKNFETNERYKNRIESATRKLDAREDKRMDPEVVALALFKLSNKKHPKAMKIIGAKMKILYFVERWLPKNLILKLDNKLYGGKE